MTTTYIILIVYLGIMLAIGFYGRKYASTTKDFLNAGKQGTMIMVAGSFMASHIGSGFVVGGAEYGAIWGIGGAWYGIACAFSYFLFAPLVSRRAYKADYLTISDFLEDRYDNKIVQAGFAIMNIIASIGIIGGQIMAGHRLLIALGMPGIAGAVITTIVVIGYASISGLWGVLMTDAVQVAVVIIGLVISIVMMISTGAMDFITQTLSSEFFTAVPFSNVVFVAIVVPTTLYGLLSQASYQRVAASKTEDIAVKSPILAGIILIPIAFLPVIIGMYGRALFPQEAAGTLFFKVLLEQFNPVVSGLVIAAVFAAIMSTADSQLLGITANVTHDLIERIGNRDLKEKESLRVSIVTTIGVGLFALILSLSFSNIVSLFSFVYTILVSACLAPVFGGMIWKDGTSEGALAGMAFGIITILLSRFGVISLGHNILAVVPSAIAYIIVSLITKNKNTIKEV